MMGGYLLQLYILGTALAALRLMPSRDRRRRLIGCLVGLAGQPGWLYALYGTGQWGMFAGSVGFTFLYLQGVLENRP